MNIFFPPHQETVFALMSLVGALLGFIYDAFKFKRILFGKCTLVLFFDDFTFMLISCVIFILSVFILNNGRIRWYEFAFCIIGFSVYRITLSKIIMPFLILLAKMIRRLALFIFCTFSKPFAIAFAVFSKNAVKIISPISLNFYILMQKMKILSFVKNIWSLK